MRRQIKIVLGAFALVVLTILAVGGWDLMTLNLPMFKGKSAVYWMNYDYRGPNPDLEFREVWKGLGSNAVPFLVECLDKRDKPLPRIEFEPLWSKLPQWLKVIVPRPSPPANVVRSRAVSALRIIGEHSKPAIPTLLRIVKTDESLFIRDAATNALKAIDPEAVAKAGLE